MVSGVAATSWFGRVTKFTAVETSKPISAESCDKNTRNILAFDKYVVVSVRMRILLTAKPNFVVVRSVAVDCGCRVYIAVHSCPRSVYKEERDIARQWPHDNNTNLQIDCMR